MPCLSAVGISGLQSGEDVKTAEGTWLGQIATGQFGPLRHHQEQVTIAVGLCRPHIWRVTHRIKVLKIFTGIERRGHHASEQTVLIALSEVRNGGLT